MEISRFICRCSGMKSCETMLITNVEGKINYTKIVSLTVNWVFCTLCLSNVIKKRNENPIKHLVCVYFH